MTDVDANTLHTRPKKSLGQNFLVDENIARNIIRDLHLTCDDVVVEIGPGRGVLTKYLAERAGAVLAVELDDRLAEALGAQYTQPHVRIVHHDFLEVNLREIQKQYRRALRLIGNIPYNLTSQILIKAFDEREALQDFTFMMQREVARRLTAKPGSKDYGILSVYAQFYGEVKTLFNVSPNCFFPKPRVSSTVVQARLHDTLPYNGDESIFRLIVRTSFGKRRKVLRNALKYLPFDEEVIQRILSRGGTMLDRRPEQLHLNDYIALTKLASDTLDEQRS